MNRVQQDGGPKGEGTVTAIVPDPAAMLAYLKHQFGKVPDDLRDGLIELGSTDPKDGKLKFGRLLKTTDLNKVVEIAARLNAIPGKNLYIGAALRRSDAPRDRRASDKDFRALLAPYADFDNPGDLDRAEELCRKLGVPPTMKVITGRHPHVRGQLYWRLAEPIRDPAVSRKLNRAIAAALGGDMSVHNPGRVLRLPGSVAWPKKSGRVVERTELVLFSDGRPAAYSLGQIEEAFPGQPGPAIPPAAKDAGSKKALTHPAKPHIAAPPLPPSASAEQLLASIGPDNWHTPMLRAVAKLVAQGRSDDDILALAVRYTLPGWTEAQTRAEVQAMIDGARRKGFDDPKPRVGPLKPDVPPSYPTMPLPAAEAVTRLRTTTEEWFAQSCGFAQARGDLRNLCSALFGPAFMSQVRRELVRKGVLPAPLDEVDAIIDRHTLRIRAREVERIKKKLLKKWGLSTLSHGPRVSIQAAAGLGKTHEVVRQILADPGLRGLRVWVMVPTLDLAQQLVESFGPPPRPYIRVMRGRLAKATDARGPKEPKSMCRKPSAAELAGNKLGLNVYRTICKFGEDRCDFFDRCPWIDQWNDTKPGIFIFSHEYLFLPKLPQFPKPDIVIIDESFIESAVGRVDFLPDRLTEPAPWKSGDMEACLQRIRVAVEGDKPLLLALREAGLTRAILAEALKKAEGGIGGGSGVSPEMDEMESVMRLSVLERSEQVKLARLLRQLHAEFDLPRDACHSVFFRRNMPVKVEGVIERQNRIVVAHRRKLQIPASVPILAIDADADPGISRLIFGERLKHVHIPVARKAEVIQCYSSTFSKQSLVGFPGASERALAWAAKRLAAVKRLILERAKELPAFVVANLPVRRKITGERDKGTTLAFEWGPALISHFGRIRGIDAWKNRQLVIVVGREQPPPEEIETLARGLYFDDPAPLALSGAYTKALRGYRLKDGRRLGVEVDVHLDPRVQRVLELKRERESAQAIDRVRLVHAENPKTVIILSNLPLDIDVDRLVSWRDLANGGCRLDQALRRNGWALPLVPSCLARNWPDLFPSPRAAEHEIARKKLDNPDRMPGDSDLPKSQQGIYWLLGRSQFRPAAQNNGGHRRWSEALLAADTPHFRARVRDAMGCALVWEQPPTCRVFFKINQNGGVS